MALYITVTNAVDAADVKMSIAYQCFYILCYLSTFLEAILWRNANSLKWAGTTRIVVINLKIGLIGVSRGISSVAMEWLLLM